MITKTPAMFDDVVTATRSMCASCWRPQRTCVCHWITRVDNHAEVLILQHPLEVGNAKGSGRLLHLCLARSRLMVGEKFAEDVLQDLLYGPFLPAPSGMHSAGQGAYGSRPVRTVLLYPESDAVLAGGSAPCVPPCVPLMPAVFSDDVRIRLVVLDGTWRKSRKQLYCNPLLQSLPRMALTGAGQSRYRIRKAHRSDQLSTFEATCHALAQLEGHVARYQPMLAAFDGFVSQQIGYGFVPASDADNAV